MTGCGPRPIVAGYLAVPMHASRRSAARPVREWSASFAAYAHQEGLAPGEAFTDVWGREGSGLAGLAGYLRRDGVVGVVVPDLTHLTQACCLAAADRRAVQRYLHAAVLPMRRLEEET